MGCIRAGKASCQVRTFSMMREDGYSYHCLQLIQASCATCRRTEVSMMHLVMGANLPGVFFPSFSSETTYCSVISPLLPLHSVPRRLAVSFFSRALTTVSCTAFYHQTANTIPWDFLFLPGSDDGRPESARTRAWMTTCVTCTGKSSREFAEVLVDLGWNWDIKMGFKNRPPLHLSYPLIHTTVRPERHFISSIPSDHRSIDIIRNVLLKSCRYRSRHNLLVSRVSSLSFIRSCADLRVAAVSVSGRTTVSKSSPTTRVTAPPLPMSRFLRMSVSSVTLPRTRPR